MRWIHRVPQWAKVFASFSKKKRFLPADGSASMAVIGWHAEAPNPLLAAAPADTSRTEYERRQAEQAWRQAEIELEAGRVGAARPWLERAFRFTPSDQNLAFALATARLGDGDFAAALDLLNR